MQEGCGGSWQEAGHGQLRGTCHLEPLQFPFLLDLLYHLEHQGLLFRVEGLRCKQLLQLLQLKLMLAEKLPLMLCQVADAVLIGGELQGLGTTGLCQEGILCLHRHRSIQPSEDTIDRDLLSSSQVPKETFHQAVIGLGASSMGGPHCSGQAIHWWLLLHPSS